MENTRQRFSRIEGASRPHGCAGCGAPASAEHCPSCGWPVRLGP